MGSALPQLIIFFGFVLRLQLTFWLQFSERKVILMKWLIDPQI